MLRAFIDIRKKVTDISVSPSEIIGRFMPSGSDITLLKTLSNNSLDEFIKSGNKSKTVEEVKPGELIEIKLYPLQINDGYYFETVEELINKFSQRLPNLPYYIYQLDFHSESGIKPEAIIKYENTIRLIALLSEISDYQKQLGNINELVFFQSQKLVLVTKYSGSDLNEIKNISILQSQLSSTHDKEERKIIFITELINTLIGIDNQAERFKLLLLKFDDVFEKYQKGHKFYLEQFSYEKIKSELDSAKIDYAKKLQEVINSIQTKLISIPAAFLLIISQFDLTGEDLWKNISLLISSFVFSYLLDILISNQFTSLSVISDDLKSFKKRFLEKKERLPVNDFNPIFSAVEEIHKKQKRNLYIIRCLVWLTPVFSIALFLFSNLN